MRDWDPGGLAPLRAPAPGVVRCSNATSPIALLGAAGVTVTAIQLFELLPEQPIVAMPSISKPTAGKAGRCGQRATTAEPTSVAPARRSESFRLKRVMTPYPDYRCIGLVDSPKMSLSEGERMTSMYARLGGNLTRIRDLANEFYDVMDSDPYVRDLRDLHPQKLHSAKKHLYQFLAQWLGGPRLFGEQYANAAWMELRHRHFDLNDENARQWLYCMDTAMTNLGIDAKLKTALRERFSGLIKAMQNRREAVTTESRAS